MRLLFRTFAAAALCIPLACSRAGLSDPQGVRGSDNGGNWVTTQFNAAAVKVPEILDLAENRDISTSDEIVAITEMIRSSIHTIAYEPKSLPGNRFIDEQHVAVQVAGDQFLDGRGQPRDALVVYDSVESQWVILLNKEIFFKYFDRHRPIMRLVCHEIWRLAYFNGLITRNDEDGVVTNRLVISSAYEDHLVDLGSGTWDLMPEVGAETSDTVAVAGGKLLVVKNPSDVFTLDTVTRRWAPGPSLPDTSQLLGFSLVRAANDKFILFGGDSNNAHVDSPVNVGYVLGSDASEWSRISNVNAPSPRQRHLAVTTNEGMIVWGGIKGYQGGVSFYRDGGIYDVQRDQWTPIPAIPNDGLTWNLFASNMAWTGENGLGRFKNKLLVWRTWDTPVGQSSCQPLVYMYDPSSNQWEKLSSSNVPRGACQWEHAIWANDRFVIYNPQHFIDSFGNEAAGQVWNPLADTWSEISGIDAPLRAHRNYYYGDTPMLWNGSKFIVFGGQDKHGNCVNSGAMYDPLSNSWSVMAESNAPSPRYRARLLWDAGHMVVSGGSSCGGNGISGAAIFTP